MKSEGKSKARNQFSEDSLDTKIVKKILSSGWRLQNTNYQMHRDLPQEIIRRKPQIETLKKAKKMKMKAAFSSSQPDKLFINTFNNFLWEILAIWMGF